MTSTATRDIFLTNAEFDVVWSHLGLGPMPYPLAVLSVGFLPEERAAVVDKAWADLATDGLARGTEVAEDLAERLRLLAQPAISVDALGDIGSTLRALAVRDGNVAALAILTGEGLTLRSIRPTSLAGSITSLLPDAGPGPGHAFTFPQGVLRAILADGDDDDDPFFGGDDHDVLVRAGMSVGDARLLGELVASRRYGGQFGINTRRRSRGGMDRLPTLVTWFDTPSGRYLVVREQDWVSVTPTGSDRIATRIDQLLANAAGDR
ncbi:MAG TPA: ESX secretion-associated protein EspG [Pseudonocardiaceae bacterium]|jgi:hypothetical protein